MKKFMVAVLTLVCIFFLASCGWNSRPVIAAEIYQNVSKIEITHHIGGQTTTWSVEGTEIDNLQEWLDKLDYKTYKVKDGQSPGDSDGAEVYTFVLTGGEWEEFSYVINGQNDCYLQSEGNWFSVNNPTNPPVSEPTK